MRSNTTVLSRDFTKAGNRAAVFSTAPGGPGAQRRRLFDSVFEHNLNCIAFFFPTARRMSTLPKLVPAIAQSHINSFRIRPDHKQRPSALRAAFLQFGRKRFVQHVAPPGVSFHCSLNCHYCGCDRFGISRKASLARNTELWLQPVRSARLRSNHGHPRAKCRGRTTKWRTPSTERRGR